MWTSIKGLIPLGQTRTKITKCSEQSRSGGVLGAASPKIPILNTIKRIAFMVPLFQACSLGASDSSPIWEERAIHPLHLVVSLELHVNEWTTSIVVINLETLNFDDHTRSVIDHIDSWGSFTRAAR